MPTWDPTQYAVFADHRGRPFADLLGRVVADDPRLVVDLGCGDGPLTLGLAQRWPRAHVVGLDASVEMLDRAREHDRAHRVEWRQVRAQDWDPAGLGAPVDVLVSNATLQWVPEHRELLPRWVDALAPGGWLALQVPANFGAPSHRLMREVAADGPWAPRLAGVLRHDDAVAEPREYLALLAGLGLGTDVWETTYLHVLDPHGAQRQPVLEWVRGTGLRPVLDALTDEGERAAFVERYTAALDAAYPRTPYGVVLPFRRLFAVARKP